MSDVALMTPRSYVVERVTFQKPVQLDHGQFTDHKCVFAGVGEVSWLRKAESPAPHGEVYGHLEEGPFGLKFKQDQRPAESNGGGSLPPPQPNGYGRDPQPDDRQASIIRQHSQHMALQAVSAGLLENSVKRLDELLPVIDWFDRDAGQRTASAGSPPPVVGAGASSDLPFDPGAPTELPPLVENDPVQPPAPADTGPSEKQLGFIRKLCQDVPDAGEILQKLFGHNDLSQLTGGKGGTASLAIDTLLKAKSDTTPPF